MKTPLITLLLLAGSLGALSGQSLPTAQAALQDPAKSVPDNRPQTLRVFRLKYAQAGELRDKVRVALSDKGNILVDDRTNTLIVNDENDSLKALADLLKELDVPAASLGGNPPPGGAAMMPNGYSAARSLYGWQPGERPPAGAANVGPLIFFSGVEPKTLDELAEDLNIFGFLLNRDLNDKLGEEAPVQKLGVSMLLKANGRSDKPFYVEGFGACFSMRVHFPLLPPANEEPKKETTNADSDWQKARSALYGGSGSASVRNWALEPSGQEIPYDARLVQVLKKTVGEAMKNAVNIRHLGPQESVVVTIIGTPNVAAGHLITTSRSADPFAVGSATFTGPAESAESGRATVITIRAEKQVLAELAKNDASYEAMESKLQIHMYLGAVAAAAGSGTTLTLPDQILRAAQRQINDPAAQPEPFPQKK